MDTQPATDQPGRTPRSDRYDRGGIEAKLGYSISRTAFLLDLARPTIYKMIADGRLRSVKIGPRHRIVTTESINELLNG